ncbi:protein suppressor of underreplication [Drosophila nasuta]|uniref:protein suppressor of underreplication n=1 Tax=Drosophila nasuta TaxID=42062 RepID=UPI00295F240B|nr:protein suppressor of underreplication [Drosophila nasuta]
MYHLVSEQTAELRLSDNVLIGNQTTQYLKPFQLEAVRFLYDRFSKQEFCIFNDESGLGKTASIAAFLSGLNTSKKTLVVLQNDDHLLAGWQFHLGVLTDLSVCVVKDVNDSTESAHSVYLSKWSILRSIGDLSKLKFDYIIVDHRGFTLNNSFCSSMLLKHYEGKVNIVISSVDITSDVKLLYNVLRLGGCLEHQYKTIQAFERKFHLPDVKEVLSKRVDLEEYYKQRGVLGEYIKDYRLRRYRHQFESYLPLVTEEQYKINLSRWLGENNSNSTISQTTLESSSEPLSTGNTDEISECLRNMKREPELTGGNDNAEILSECSDEVVAMEPLFLQLSESEVEEVSKDRAETIGDECRSPFIDVVTVSSDDCEIISLSNTPPPHQPTRSPATRKKRKFTKRLQQAENIELTESETEEASPSSSNRKSLNVRLCRVMLPQKKHQETESAEPRKAPLRKPASKKTDEEMTKKPSNEMTTSKSTGVSQSESDKASTSKSKEEQQKTPMKKSPQKVQAVNVVADTSTDQPTTSKATRGRKSESKSPTEHTFKKPQAQKMQSKPAQSPKTVSKTPENESTSSKSTQLRKAATAASKTPTPQAETKSTQVKKPANVTPKKPQEQTKSKTAKEDTAATKSTQATPKKPSQTTAKKPQTEKTPLKSKQTSPKEATEPKTKQATKTEPATSKKTPQQKKTSADEQMGPLKQERSATPNSEPKTRRSYLRDRNSDDVDQRQTRGMQRLTRSAESRIQSKYMSPLKALQYDKKSPVKGKRSHDAVQTPKASKRKREEDNVKQEETADNRSSTTMTEDEPPPKRKVGRPRKVAQDNQRVATPEVTKKTEITQKVATQESSKQANITQKVDKQESSKQANITQKVDTPELLSSGSNASDYSYLQCAQKLPDNLTELEAFQDFRIPEVPQATPLMLSSSLNVNFFSDSEVIVVPSSIPKQEVVVINSSNEECSQQSNTQSRRTRALKRKVSKEPSQPSASTSNFGLLLGEQRARVNKSPDIFSNCSDFSQITLAQPVPQPSPFEGFKIFGSEVKQHQVKTQQSIGTQKKRERSCLDILENMFEPHKTKTNKSGINLLPMLPSPKKQLPQRRFTLLDEDIFEITNNGEFGSRLRLNSNGHVSPVFQVQQQHQQQPQATQQLQQRNKITKYLIGSGCTPEDTGQRIQALSPAQRKSPKSIKSTQSTKLTRWFGTADATTSQSAPSTPQVPADKAAAARVARSGGPTKRKQLNLFK